MVAEPTRVLLTWEYNFEGGLPDPLGAITKWAASAENLRWDQCQRLSVIRRKGEVGLQAEMLSPASHPWRHVWVRQSIIRTHSLLLLLQALPRSLLSSFEPHEVAGFDELCKLPFELPPTVVADVMDVMERAGSAFLVGHDAQYLFSFSDGV